MFFVSANPTNHHTDASLNVLVKVARLSKTFVLGMVAKLPRNTNIPMTLRKTTLRIIALSMMKRHNDTQYNTQNDGTQNGDIQHNRITKFNPKTLCNTQHNDNLYNHTQLNNSEHNNSQHNNFQK
jgi:hypothetical protein